MNRKKIRGILGIIFVIAFIFMIFVDSFSNTIHLLAVALMCMWGLVLLDIISPIRTDLGETHQVLHVSSKIKDVFSLISLSIILLIYFIFVIIF